MFQKLVLAMLVSLTVTRAMPLVDLDPSCDRLTSLGDCDESPEWMLRFCTRSCFAYYESSTEAPSDDPEENRELAGELSSLARKLLAEAASNGAEAREGSGGSDAELRASAIANRLKAAALLGRVVGLLGGDFNGTGDGGGSDGGPSISSDALSHANFDECESAVSAAALKYELVKEHCYRCRQQIRSAPPIPLEPEESAVGGLGEAKARATEHQDQQQQQQRIPSSCSLSAVDGELERVLRVVALANECTGIVVARFERSRDAHVRSTSKSAASRRSRRSGEGEKKKSKSKKKKKKKSLQEQKEQEQKEKAEEEKEGAREGRALEEKLYAANMRHFHVSFLLARALEFADKQAAHSEALARTARLVQPRSHPASSLRSSYFFSS